MRRSAVRWSLPAGVAAGVLAAWVDLPLPPRAGPATGVPAPGDVRLAYHIHTLRSDGTGSVEEVAAAARRAGLAAVVVTDHGDGTRQTDPPRYVDGVLVIDGVEISTWGGHYTSIGAAASPYPLGGEPDAVAEDVRRLGGFGLAAHPGSNKEGLKWRDWDAPFDGLEWLNADSEWRDRPADVWRSLATYLFRPAETITALLNRPSFELAQWDRQAARRPVIGLAAHDAHARMGLRGVGEPYDGVVALRVPSYEAMFKAFSNVVRIAHPLSGDAASDAAEVMAAVAAGQAYTVVTGLAPSGLVTFDAESGGLRASMGGHLVPSASVAVAFAADVPAGAHVTLRCDGRVVATGAGGRIAWSTSGAAGACRAEVAVGADVPWLVTNPIYIRTVLSTLAPRDVPAPQLVLPVDGSGVAAQWAVELAPGARGVASAVAGHPGRVSFAWQLGDGLGQYAALRFDTPPSLAQFDRVILRGAADRPMRVWLQLRSPNGGGRRWGRSVYVDKAFGEIGIPFHDFLPLDSAGGGQVPIADVTALLVVVDTVHARPGASGTLVFDELWLAR